MTDENVIPLPASRVDDTEPETGEERQDPERGQRRSSDEEEPNPLLREGPDAPDAADIEDPDEQL